MEKEILQQVITDYASENANLRIARRILETEIANLQEEVKELKEKVKDEG